MGRLGSVSDPQEIAARRKRRIELVFFVVSAFLIITITLSFLIRKNVYPEKIYLKCGTDSEDMIEVDGTVDDDGVLKSSDGMNYSHGQFWISDDNETKWGCPCMVKPCVNKCCGYGEKYYPSEWEGDSECRNDSSLFDLTQRGVYSVNDMDQRVSVESGHYHIFPNHTPCIDNYLITGQENKKALLLEDGRIYTNGSIMPFTDHDKYCMESFNGSSEIVITMCFADMPQEEEWKHILRMVGFITSLPCLLATLLTYLVLPQLRNLHGKALVCHTASLTVAYSGLTASFFEQYLPKGVCTTVGYAILFSTLASFFWLNVMSFDIWWVFSGLMPMQGTQKQLEQLKFRLYSAYAWGGALAITALALTMDFYPVIPYSLRPAMGVYSCFFSGKDSRMLYLYLPIGVVVYLNTAMFLTTSLRFKKHARCVKRLQRGDSRRNSRTGKALTDVQRFSLYVKLSLVMGLTWILEVVGFLFDNSHHLWLIAEMINALQGLPIMYMFVCKPRVLAMLNQRLCPSLRLFTTERSVRTLTSSIKSNTSISSKPRKGSDAEYQLTTINAEMSA